MRRGWTGYRSDDRRRDKRSHRLQDRGAINWGAHGKSRDARSLERLRRFVGFHLDGADHTVSALLPPEHSDLITHLQFVQLEEPFIEPC
jgi:hypothetical protein